MTYVNNELDPLQQWFCDSCGDTIVKPEEGWLEWYRTFKDDVLNKDEGFRIVHHDKRCMYNSRAMFLDNKLTADMHLEDYLGVNGLVYLLSYIQHDSVKDNREMIEIIRRLHVPYYEEARLYHNIAEENGYFDGENEITRYITRTSIYILNHYKNK